MITIKKAIADVKNGKGLYHEASRCKGDLHSLKFIVSDYTGLNIKASGELGRELRRLAESQNERERIIKKAGISYGIWVYTKDICKYPSHAKSLSQKELSYNESQ